MDVSKLRQQLKEASSAPTGEGTVSPDADRNVAALRMEIEELEEKLKEAVSRATKAETMASAAEDQADRSQRALAAAIESHRQEKEKILTEASSTKNAAAQAKYIKDLEKELDGWRTECSRLEDEVERLKHRIGDDEQDGQQHKVRSSGSDAQGDDSDTVTPSRNASQYDEVNSPSPAPASVGLKSAETIQMLTEQLSKAELRITQLQEKLKSKDDIISKVDSHLSELKFEVRAREDAVNEMFDENKQLKSQAVVLNQRFEELKSIEFSYQQEVESLKEELMAMEEKVGAAEDTVVVTKRSMASLQTDVAARNETIRQLRNELATVKTSQAPQHATVTVSVSKPPPDHSGTHTTSVSGPADAKALFFKLMSNPRTRSYTIAAVVVILITMFSFYQSGTIVEDEAHAELLRRCKEHMKSFASKSHQAIANAVK